MNSIKPALDVSFTGFSERGGRTGEHSDGWGIAFHESAGCRLIIDDQPSTSAPLAQAIRLSPIKARNVVAHIRKATQGAIAPQNSPPFTRSLCGRTWSFSHNGNLDSFRPAPDGHYQCAGETDSERAFCYLTAGLRRRFPLQPPSRSALAAAVKAMAGVIARHGTFNFILSNGEFLLAHCSTKVGSDVIALVKSTEVSIAKVQ